MKEFKEQQQTQEVFGFTRKTITENYDRYIVIMERQKNDMYENPVWLVYIIKEERCEKYLWSKKIKKHGRYLGTQFEAEVILEEELKKIGDKK